MELKNIKMDIVKKYCIKIRDLLKMVFFMGMVLKQMLEEKFSQYIN
jgi:hypothetical protein